jgi:hypothetical protein
MQQRLVLIDCIGNHVTPWLVVQRGDYALSISGLGAGELIRIETRPSGILVAFQSGQLSLPARATAFRVVKCESNGGSTFVSVLNDRTKTSGADREGGYDGSRAVAGSSG